MTPESGISAEAEREIFRLRDALEAAQRERDEARALGANEERTLNWMKADRAQKDAERALARAEAESARLRAALERAEKAMHFLSIRDSTAPSKSRQEYMEPAWIDLNAAQIAVTSALASSPLSAAVAKVIAAAERKQDARHDRMNDGGSDCFNGCPACAAEAEESNAAGGR